MYSFGKVFILLVLLQGFLRGKSATFRCERLTLALVVRIMPHTERVERAIGDDAPPHLGLIAAVALDTFGAYSLGRGQFCLTSPVRQSNTALSTSMRAVRYAVLASAVLPLKPTARSPAITLRSFDGETYSFAGIVM